MTKVPDVAEVKTRLRPILSHDQCSSLAKCFLLDMVAKAEHICGNVIVAFSPKSGRQQLRDIIGEGLQIVPQEEGDLGERLVAVIDKAFALGFGPVIMTGTDSPTLPYEYIANAIEYLQIHENGITLGPTDDGGYYLIGVSKKLDGIFQDVTWSSDKVFAQTISNIKKIEGIDLLTLPQWYDVDEPDDLIRLQAELRKDILARNRAGETYRWFIEYQDGFAAVPLTS